MPDDITPVINFDDAPVSFPFTLSTDAQVYRALYKAALDLLHVEQVRNQHLRRQLQAARAQK
jgi:hypothetical protein